MKREKLEQYIGKKVRVTLFDGYMAEGILCKTGEEYKGIPNLYIPQNYYFLKREGSRAYVVSVLFRSSHVRRLEENLHASR